MTTTDHDLNERAAEDPDDEFCESERWFVHHVENGIAEIRDNNGLRVADVVEGWGDNRSVPSTGQLVAAAPAMHDALVRILKADKADNAHDLVFALESAWVLVREMREEAESTAPHPADAEVNTQAHTAMDSASI